MGSRKSKERKAAAAAAAADTAYPAAPHPEVWKTRRMTEKLLATKEGAAITHSTQPFRFIGKCSVQQGTVFLLENGVACEWYYGDARTKQACDRAYLCCEFTYGVNYVGGAVFNSDGVVVLPGDDFSGSKYMDRKTIIGFNYFDPKSTRRNTKSIKALKFDYTDAVAVQAWFESLARIPKEPDFVADEEWWHPIEELEPEGGSAASEEDAEDRDTSQLPDWVGPQPSRVTDFAQWREAVGLPPMYTP